MDLYLDTSFIVPLIIETDTTRKARDFYTSFSGTVATGMSVYEESFFVGLRLIARNEFGIVSTTQLKNYILARGYGFADEFLRNLNEVFSGLEIISDTVNLPLVEEMARKYSLLPNDALIVATCRENKIPRLATFDKDFVKVKSPVKVKV